jgi:hypothetical protein
MKKKNSFINPFETYCYLRMLEGLCNTGPTFCKMMKEPLKDQLNIVVASKKRENYISNLVETFMNMHEARLKLNPEKCAFGIIRGRPSDV